MRFRGKIFLTVFFAFIKDFLTYNLNFKQKRNLPALLNNSWEGSTVTFRRQPVVNPPGRRLPLAQVLWARRLHLQPRRRAVRSRALSTVVAAQTACPHHRA